MILEKKEWNWRGIEAFKILGDKDYNLLTKILGYLKYRSIGEYLYIDSLEFDDYLDMPHFYSNSTFMRKRAHFFSGVKYLFETILDEMRGIIYKKHEERLFEKLNYGLLNIEFKSETHSIEYLEIRIEKYYSFNMYLKSIGYDNSHYLSFMEMRLNERKRIDKEFKLNKQEHSDDCEIITNLSDEINFEDNTNVEYQIENTTHHQLAYFQFFGTDNDQFTSFIVQLKYMNYIDDEETFKSIFILSNKIYSNKILWKKSLSSLIFLFVLFDIMDLIKLSNKKYKNIANTFYLTGKKIITPHELSRLTTMNSFSGLSKKNIRATMTETSNRDITELFQLYYSIF